MHVDLCWMQSSCRTGTIRTTIKIIPAPAAIGVRVKNENYRCRTCDERKGQKVSLAERVQQETNQQGKKQYTIKSDILR